MLPQIGVKANPGAGQSLVYSLALSQSSPSQDFKGSEIEQHLHLIAHVAKGRYFLVLSGFQITPSQIPPLTPPL